MDNNMKSINFEPCDFVVEENIQTSILDNGRLLKVSLCLMDICPKKSLMVGVLIYLNSRPYALKIKEINRRNNPICNSCSYDDCCGCSFCCKEDFEFLFLSDICEEELTFKVISHYIF